MGSEENCCIRGIVCFETGRWGAGVCDGGRRLRLEIRVAGERERERERKGVFTSTCPTSDEFASRAKGNSS